MESPEPESGEVTRLLRAWRDGDGQALERLVPLVYNDLRQLAAQRLRSSGSGLTLQPTALVHEAFLRLVGGKVDWQSRAHFFAVASRTMRNVAVDYARRRQADKRGGGVVQVELSDETPAPATVDVVALDEALSRLEQLDARQARVVELRFFAGLSVEETAAVLECSPITVSRAWRTARAWLFRELHGSV
ncbi:MAG TPA: sigma-70 family RNA polymerase sigma factor [Thermoanaerobaculia bacterium]|nr:sigma-70 family RNA polymerase sigma factor [Thermoanaerobaculia bacterium]